LCFGDVEWGSVSLWFALSVACLFLSLMRLDKSGLWNVDILLVFTNRNEWQRYRRKNKKLLYFRWYLLEIKEILKTFDLPEWRVMRWGLLGPYYLSTSLQTAYVPRIVCLDSLFINFHFDLSISECNSRDYLYDVLGCEILQTWNVFFFCR
jgi:hypothetical protein